MIHTIKKNQCQMRPFAEPEVNNTLIRAQEQYDQKAQDMRQAITKHGAYVDLNGTGATSIEGLIQTIEGKIKNEFTLHPSQMSADTLKTIANLRSEICTIVKEGEAENLTRRQIKTKIYSAIKKPK